MTHLLTTQASLMHRKESNDDIFSEWSQFYQHLEKVKFDLSVNFEFWTLLRCHLSTRQILGITHPKLSFMAKVSHSPGEERYATIPLVPVC